jgi:hypothetical protein
MRWPFSRPDDVDSVREDRELKVVKGRLTNIETTLDSIVERDEEIRIRLEVIERTIPVLRKEV